MTRPGANASRNVFIGCSFLLFIERFSVDRRHIVTYQKRRTSSNGPYDTKKDTFFPHTIGVSPISENRARNVASPAATHHRGALLYPRKLPPPRSPAPRSPPLCSYPFIGMVFLFLCVLFARLCGRARAGRPGSRLSRRMGGEPSRATIASPGQCTCPTRVNFACIMRGVMAVGREPGVPAADHRAAVRTTRG